MIDAAVVRNLPGAAVLGPNGEKVGTVGQVFVDQMNGKPSWATVHTGLFGRSESFVPLETAVFDGERLTVGFDKSIIRDAPHIGTDGALTPAMETSLFEYYGMIRTVPVVEEYRPRHSAEAPPAVESPVAADDGVGEGDAAEIPDAMGGSDDVDRA